MIQHVPVGDPWEPVTSLLVTPHIFGPGSFRMFPWYFEGTSTVHVRSLEDVCRWLAACEYVSDDHLFNEADFWQHPRTFEHLRKGDCEDHALWAWRKLVEMGHQADFFVGQWFDGGSEGRDRHAWVVFEQNGQRFVLEAVSKDATAMIHALPNVCSAYAPHFSVNAAFGMQAHAGYLLYLKTRDSRRRGSARNE